MKSADITTNNSVRTPGPAKQPQEGPTMASIEWRDDYSTGVQALDEQHRQLVEILNSLEDAVRRDRERRIVDGILNDLIGYTQEHFSFEEQALARAGFADFTAHQRRNRQWIREIERFHHEHLTAGRPLTAEFRRSLRAWLREHLAQGDRVYRTALAGRPADG
jgi:hemerythrin-like metal-binding protein